MEETVDKKNYDLLDDCITESIKDLLHMQPGTPEKTAEVENLTKLFKTKNDQIEAFNESEIEKAKLKDAKKDRIVKIGIAGAELTIPLIFYGIWMQKGFKFEENGTFTSTTFRGLFNKFKPTKR